jgi:hypothetical protein
MLTPVGWDTWGGDDKASGGTSVWALADKDDAGDNITTLCDFTDHDTEASADNALRAHCQALRCVRLGLCCVPCVRASRTGC